MSEGEAWIYWDELLWEVRGGLGGEGWVGIVEVPFSLPFNITLL